MAIFYNQMSVVSRSSGRSAVAAIAYRTAETLTNERDGLVHKYENRQGVEHSEIVLPDGVDADWALDRSALWNAAERAEKRADARVAREFVVALPHELSEDGRLELTRAFAQDLANRYGVAVDFAIHAPHPQGDVRNHHAHVMMTTRQVTAEGLGAKTYIELANKELLPKGLPSTQVQLVDIRRSWEGMANERLAREGLDIRIDHRSHSERGLEIEPTEHVGVRATNILRRGGQVERARLDKDAARKNAELIREKPEQVLTIITGEKSVFDRHDIARALHRYINDDAQAYQNAFASVMASPALVELQAERSDPETGEVLKARYSTREMVEIENAMAERAEVMKHARSHGVDRHHVDRAIEKQDVAIRASVGDVSAGLSDEQRLAIEHVTGLERIAAVVGFAGAGKSTMLMAAREAWEAQGYTIHGAALSGKAAEGLEESSGIQSRTLASWTHNWDQGKRQLGRGDVFVIDEAGMIGSRQMARFLGEAETRGAKIVLVGDHEQLQAIGAGAPFRAIAEQIGHAELTDIRRQREDWQREASVFFATHKTAEGLAAYRDHGDIHLTATSDEARVEIVRDYLSDRNERSEGTRVAMAHRRADVRAINDAIRTELQQRGELAKVEPVSSGEAREIGEGQGIAPDHERAMERPRALTYQTNDGKREFAEGDRLVFLENDRNLGVKNGMLGTVKAVEPDAIHVWLDGKGSAQPGEENAGYVRVDLNSYQSVDHGYATTIHKNQGATVDRAYVLASGTMDRHLTYVAMTRHRDGVRMYASQEEFTARKANQMLAAGKLVEHGVAPYERKAGNLDSYFVTLENSKGERHTTWGVGLKQAMAEAAPEIGETIALKHEGSVPVTLPDETIAERNSWKVTDGQALAYEQLTSRLSRSGMKETTLDYISDFAERRGIAEQLGVRSEIMLADGAERAQEKLSGDRYDVVTPDREPAPRRSMFAGLKLSRGAPAETTGPEQAEAIKPQLDREGIRDGGRSERQQPHAERETAPVAKRSMFDGLKLKAAPAQSGPVEGHDDAMPLARRQERNGARLAPGQQLSETDRLAERIRPMSGFEQALDGYAKVLSSAVRQQHDGLPILDGQRQALNHAAQRLDQMKPGTDALLRSAIQYDLRVQDAMTQLSGRERVDQLISGMDRERVALADPNIRADRFIERWNELKSERQQLRGWQHDEARGKVETQMRGMSQSLERDPQLESTLRNRSQELGISSVRQSHTLLQEMERQVQSRSQSLGMER